MLKIMGKKIFTLLRCFFCLSKPVKLLNFFIIFSAEMRDKFKDFVNTLATIKVDEVRP